MTEEKQEERQNDVAFAVMQTDLNYIKDEIKVIKELLEKKYVSLAEFKPIRNIVYGMVGMVLVAVFGGLLALVIRGG